MFLLRDLRDEERQRRAVHEDAPQDRLDPVLRPAAHELRVREGLHEARVLAAGCARRVERNLCALRFVLVVGLHAFPER